MRSPLLDAAWRRLESGEPARLVDIAGDADVSRQTVYLHFESRSGLLLALVAHIDHELGVYDEIQKVMVVPDPVDRLFAVLDLTSHFEPQVHGMAMTLYREGADDPEVAAAYDDRMRHRRAGMHAAVSAVAEAGRLRSGWTVDEVVDLLWEAQAPTSYDHLVVERGWNPERWGTWTRTLATWFIADG